jgi:hypothetical protein
MQKINILEPWAEACGTLVNVIEDEPYLVLDFGKFQVRLFSDMAKGIRCRLDEEIGNWITILRTDLPDEPLLLRNL